MRKLYPAGIVLGLLAVLCAVGLALMMSPVQTTAQEPTPTLPEDTWTPGPPATKIPLPTATPAGARAQSKSANGRMELHAVFPAAWPWSEVHWQDVCTVVQWQDAWSDWHAVEGWRGTLDDVSTGVSDKIVGHKTWWVAAEDLGKGPFRWQAYRCGNGKLLATSAPFYLPSSPTMPEESQVSLMTP